MDRPNHTTHHRERTRRAVLDWEEQRRKRKRRRLRGHIGLLETAAVGSFHPPAELGHGRQAAAARPAGGPDALGAEPTTKRRH